MYSLISIIRNTEAECDEELDGQISDGIFENSIVEAVVCIFSGEIAEESGEIAEESLGRNIYFHLIMQSYMQLENIYGEIAEESLEKHLIVSARGHLLAYSTDMNKQVPEELAEKYRKWSMENLIWQGSLQVPFSLKYLRKETKWKQEK